VLRVSKDSLRGPLRFRATEASISNRIDDVFRDSLKLEPVDDKGLDKFAVEITPLAERLLS
jgi:hypothetical protein